ncbi:MAG: 2OG-Fe(II) oxygenase [Wenzhouxiangellaceae bacterium]|nr:2OG-Fe(II) oxygenase [Wenzhouxiangellaceae bacterium]
MDATESSPAASPALSWIDPACDALAAQGWFVRPDAVETDRVVELRAELDRLRADRQLKPAGIGRRREYQIERDIRGDWVYWLDRQVPAQARFLAFAEQLRLALNQRLFLALFQFEAHLALYPPGAGYERHVDSFRGHANRLVSLVLYLNPEWQPGDGGELVLHLPGPPPAQRTIEPRAGTLVLMMSEEIEHEVLPARRDRASVAGWYRLNTTTSDYLDPPR